MTKAEWAAALRERFCAGRPEQRAKAVSIALVNVETLAEWIFTQTGPPNTKYCLCDDPDYCLKFSTPEHRERAIIYRREHGAPLPRGET